MRDYTHIDRYLDILQGDVYTQPPDNGHQAAIDDVITKLVSGLHNTEKILDVGCAQGQAIATLAQYGDVTGVTLGQDAEMAQSNGFDVRHADMTFLPFDNDSFDLIFARHVIEHSPMPLITLMEWYRVSKNLLILIFPSYAHYKAQGQNHYYVLMASQWRQLVLRAGWEIVMEDRSMELQTPFETRWLCQKVVDYETNS